MNNYAELNPSINYNSALGNLGRNDYEETPAFSFAKTQKITPINDNDTYYLGGGSSLALRGLQMQNSPVSLLFFSNDNMKRIQRQIKTTVYRLTNGTFKLEADQDEQDLLLAMRYIYIEHGKNLPDHIVKQVKILNEQTLNYIIPDIITNIKQHYDYLRDITQPINPMPQPLNVGRAGRKTLPSVTSLWK